MADIFSKGLTTLNVATSTFLEEKKIQTHIDSLNEEIALLEREIGNFVFRSWVDHQDVSVESVKDKLELILQNQKKILECNENIEELRKKKHEILGTKQKGFCPNCGEPHEATMNFCKKCGSKLS